MILKLGIGRLPGAVIAFIAVALAALGMAWSAPDRAAADAFGQVFTWGSPGTGAGQLHYPSNLAVDPADHSTYVVDDMNPLTAGFQLRKFTSTGTQLGRVTLPFEEEEGHKTLIGGVAVDHAAGANSGLVYVLRYRYEEEVETPRAVGVQVFSTEPGLTGELVPPTVGPSTIPLPADSSAIYNPTGLALDPSTGNLIIAGNARDGKVVVQVVEPDGTFGTRWEDTTGTLISTFEEFESQPWGLAVAEDGKVFLAARPASGGGGGALIYSLPSDFSTASTLTPVPAGELAPSSTVAPFTTRAYGPQLAVSPDGNTVYFATWSGSFETGGLPGNYLIHGYSISAGKNAFLYGGGEGSTCKVQSEGPAIAALDNEGRVLVLDHGNLEANPPYASKVIEFGPGGSGCAFPFTSVKVNGSTHPPAVNKGATTLLEAASDELHGAQPTKLTWTITGPETGPETFTKEESGTPAPLTLAHRFLKVGAYTVELEMETDSALGSPPKVTNSLQVQAVAPQALFISSTTTPAAGAVVSFDASESVDPAGSPTGEPTFQLANYRWDFGDGSAPVDTTSPTITHAFANAGSGALARTVTLTVTNAEGLTGTVGQTLSVQGTPTSGGGGGGGTVGGSNNGNQSPPPTCATDAALCPKTGPKPKPKPKALVCKKGFKKQKVKGKLKCVKVAKHKAPHKKHASHR
jgi:hypothetical protein